MTVIDEPTIDESTVDRYRVIDCDCHIVEPYDLWTSRLSAKWGDEVPHVEWSDERQQDMWVGMSQYAAAAAPAMAGFSDFPPSRPARLSDAAPGTYDVHERLRLMDTFGIWAQVLYPNVGGFGGGSYLQLGDPELRLDCVRAYNDWLADFATAAPDRFITNAAVPFWDVEASEQEIIRAHDAGHRGIIFSSWPDRFGQPHIADPHWDRLWAVAQERQIPISFHIGSGGIDDDVVGFSGNSPRVNYAIFTSLALLSNANAIAEVIMGGVCERFPELQFISVESGIGWIPFILEAMDWQWRNTGLPGERPDWLLPSEYFRRQWYSCFWFERASVATTIESIGADRVLYETDYPHATCQAPGPASVGVSARSYISDVLKDLPESTRRKVLHDNAARLYHVS